MKKYCTLLLVLFLFTRLSNAQKLISTQEQIPILAWYGIPAGETSVERYLEMKEAGITPLPQLFPQY